MRNILQEKLCQDTWIDPRQQADPSLLSASWNLLFMKTLYIFLFGLFHQFFESFIKLDFYY
jgi:hypothetical protein